VFDSQLALKHAFFALVEHDVKGAPVWDSKIAQYVGMVTVTDFIDVIMHFHDQELSKQEFVETLEKETCQSWAMKRPNKKVFIDVLPEDKVIDAIQIMQEKNIHRLPVVSKIENENTVLGLLNHQRLLRFLVSKLQAKYSDLLKIVKIQDLKIESASELKYSTDPKCKLIDVLKMIHKNRLPVIPILDESGKYLDAYSRSDVRVIYFNLFLHYC
jgi:5'-AMP-activated protein kinase regulatory gamma subunit